MDVINRSQSIAPLHPDTDDELTLPEREQAATLWQSLLFASSLVTLQDARLELKRAVPHVQQAVMNALVSQWAQDGEAQPDDNPFRC